MLVITTKPPHSRKDVGNSQVEWKQTRHLSSCTCLLCEDERGTSSLPELISYPFCHTRVDRLPTSVLIAFAMPCHLRSLLPIFAKHHPSVVLRERQVNVQKS